MTTFPLKYFSCVFFAIFCLLSAISGGWGGGGGAEKENIEVAHKGVESASYNCKSYSKWEFQTPAATPPPPPHLKIKTGLPHACLHML